MVSNPHATPSGNDDDAGSSKKRDLDAVIHCSLDSAARQFKHQYGRDVTYAAAFLQPNGQWAIFCSPDLPAPAHSQFTRALAIPQSDVAPTRRDSAAFSDATNQSSAFDLDDDDDEDDQQPVQLAPIKPEPLTSEVSSASFASARDQTKKRKRAADDEEVWPATDDDSAELSDSDDEDDEDESGPASGPARSMTVQFHNARSTEDFFHKRFKSLQQLALKALLKVWIKTVEPKKQSRFSYVGGNPPPWWPASVRFKEPDHLHSPERIDLAKVVLRIYQDDNLVQHLEKPCQDYSRRGTARNGWIDMLRNSTKDLNLAFDQEKNPEERRVRRQEILRDIYDAAFVLEEIHHDERDARFSKTYTEPPASRRGRVRKSTNVNPRPRKTLNSTDTDTEEASALASVASQLHIESASESKPLPLQFSSHPRIQGHTNTHYRPIEPRRKISQHSDLQPARPMTTSPKELLDSHSASKLNSPTYFPPRETSAGPGSHSSPTGIFRTPMPTQAPRLDRTHSGTGLPFSQPLQSQIRPNMDLDNDPRVFQDSRYVGMQRQLTSSPHKSQGWDNPINATSMPTFPTSQPSQEFQQPTHFMPSSGPEGSFGYSTTPPLQINTSNSFPVTMDNMSGLSVSQDVAYSRQQSCAPMFDSGFGDIPFDQMFFPPPNEEEQNSFFSSGYSY